MSGGSSPFMKKPTEAAFTTSSYGMSSIKPNEPIGSFGVLKQPKSFNSFGYQKAMQKYEFQQQAMKNAQETFPFEDDPGPEAPTGDVGPPPGQLDVSMTPGPNLPPMQTVDYDALGSDPSILDPNYWRKMYG